MGYAGAEAYAGTGIGGVAYTKIYEKRNKFVNFFSPSSLAIYV